MEQRGRKHFWLVNLVKLHKGKNEIENLDSIAGFIYRLGIDVSGNQVRNRDHSTVPSCGDSVSDLGLDSGNLAANLRATIAYAQTMDIGWNHRHPAIVGRQWTGCLG